MFLCNYPIANKKFVANRVKKEAVLGRQLLLFYTIIVLITSYI